MRNDRATIRVETRARKAKSPVSPKIETEIEKRIIAVLVDNEPGVLARAAATTSRA
jgi:hypothetical protein